MKTVELYFPFTPVAKGRPRFTRTGHAYTPKKTHDFEKEVADYYKEKCGYTFDGAIQVRIIFQMPIPKSFPKKILAQIQEGSYRHAKKPDLDNMAKAVLDGLNEVAFTDDSHITRLTLSKYYSSFPGIRLTIKEDVD